MSFLYKTLLDQVGLDFLNGLPLENRRVLPIDDDLDALDFTSNDYLDLSQHPSLKSAVMSATETWGVGSTGSRLLSGNHALHESVERRVADLKKKQSALVFGGGFHTNASILATVLALPMGGKPPLLLMDKYIHACWLRGGMGVRSMRYLHQDFGHLEDIIKKNIARYTTVIVTESVFSMDGDITDLGVLADLKHRYPDIITIVDEAHATGVLGQAGAGLVQPHHDVDIVTGTFSKALGCYGGYVACSAVLRHVLIQRCEGLIYATALPPPLLAAMNAALSLLPSLQSQRDYLQNLAGYARQKLQQAGWDIGLSQTHIIPIIIECNIKCLKIKEKLREEGILVSAIRPPTVPKGTARLRLSLNAAHKFSDVDVLLRILKAL